MYGVLSVLLGGEQIGHVTRSSEGALSFGYDEEYRTRADATPLSVSMPLALADHPHRRIEGWMAGLLPESVEVLRRWRDEYGAPSLRPFDLLSTPVGRDCAGAVQFCDPYEVERLIERGGEVEPLTEAQIAQRLRDLRSDAGAWVDPRLGPQFSLAGGQPKTALYRDADGWGVPIGTTPTTHVLKPGMAHLPWTDVNEHLCLTAARHLGMPAAVTDLAVFEDQSAVVVERFDRVWEGGEPWRLHTEDLCQALGRSPDEKYQHEGGPSPAEIAALLRRHVPQPEVAVDVGAFCDAVAYNWMIGAPDAHAKNYSLFLDQGLVRLTPLYDIMSAFPYFGAGGRPVMSAMAVGEIHRIDEVGPEDWLEAASGLKVDPAAMLLRIDDLASGLPGAFASVAQDPPIGMAREFAERLLDRVGHHVGRCRRVIDQALETANR
ncbi:MAG: type II toxin-antitoxin system HipA family toxin [bacterium]|nr:type II toxin-antitoxin system HipA family toxin [bacterium]